MIHYASPDYWRHYGRLPSHARATADKCYALLKADATHPSLNLKKIGELWSVRAGIHYRALGIDAPVGEAGILWFWIGHHSVYDRLIGNQ